MRTKEKVDSILSEIEEENSEVRKFGEGYKMSGQDIADAYNRDGIFLKVTPPATNLSGKDQVLMAELGEINRKNQTDFARNFGNAGGVRKIITLMKKAYWKIRVKLFRPMFDEQNAFNAHTVASLNELNRIRCEYEYEFNEHRMTINKLIKQNQMLNSRIDRLQSLLNSQSFSTGCGLSDVEYEAFEDNFRGSFDLVKERLSMYVPYFKNAGSTILEIGSGRGEFLTLMRESNIKAVGIDIFEPFVNRCIKSGLNVKYGDGVSYLKQIEDNSLGGLFAAQVIEHLATDQLIELCKEAHRAVAPGGHVIFETPNPMCSSIFTNAFYLDPSHQKPVHPIFIQYILRMVGFDSVEIIFTEPSKCGVDVPELKGEGIENLEAFNEFMTQLGDKVYGSQDYAVVARKL